MTSNSWKEGMKMIHVVNLTKTYDGKDVVKGISFDVQAGEIFAFLGPNGVGKSTTVQMLTTLIKLRIPIRTSRK